MASTTRRPVVAIAGATGHLGKHVTSAFLSPRFSNRFSEIVLLSRQGAPPEVADQVTSVKLTVRQYDENNLVDALKGIHILVNTVGASGHEFKEKLLHALPQTRVEVYFPSEFGVDHYIHDFPHLEWDQKKKHCTLAQQLIPGVKVCRVFCGLFLEDSIGPWFGFDTTNGKYESVGSSQSPVSFTSLGDVGKAVASLAGLPKEKIPETAHIAGDTRSISEIASLMGDAGAGRVQVTEIDLRQYKEETTAKESKDPARFLRFLMGENKINHTEAGIGNDDELVNPEQQLWTWETLVDLAKRTHGQPWKDFAWPSP